MPLLKDTVLGCPFFPCLRSTVELGIWGSELSPKDVIQLAEGENEGKNYQA